MKRRTVNLVCIVLCLCMVPAIFLSCSGKGGQQETGEAISAGRTDIGTRDQTGSETGEGSGVSLDVDGNGYLKDSLDGKNYRDTEVSILSWEDNIFLFPEKYSTDDPVIALVYSRDRYIEDRLGVAFSVTKKTSNASADKEAAQALYNLVAAGTESFDAVVSYSLYPPLMAYNGLLYDLNTLEYPETEKPWYPKNLDQWEVYDRLFYITGNSAVRTFNSIHVIYANTTLLTTRGITDVIQSVIDGTWTLEQLQVYARNWASDATDNPEPTYGLLWTHRTSMDAFYYGAGFQSTVIDDEGLPQLAYTGADSQQIDDFVERIRGMMDSPECHILQKSSSQLMEAHRTVFYAGSLASVRNIGGDKEITVIPYPKRDENQSDYISIQDNAYDIWCVPFTARDPQLGAVIIEAMMSSDYRTIGPDYFDRNLKYRYSNSLEGVEIFEIIRSSLSTDFGRVNQKAMEGKSVEALIRDCVYPWTNAGNDGPVYTGRGFISRLDEVIGTHTAALQKIHTVYRNYKD